MTHRVCSLGARAHRLAGTESKLSLSRCTSSSRGLPVRLGKMLAPRGLPSICSLFSEGMWAKASGWKKWIGLPRNSTCFKYCRWEKMPLGMESMAL